MLVRANLNFTQGRILPSGTILSATSLESALGAMRMHAAQAVYLMPKMIIARTEIARARECLREAKRIMAAHKQEVRFLLHVSRTNNIPAHRLALSDVIAIAERSGLLQRLAV